MKLVVPLLNWNWLQLTWNWKQTDGCHQLLLATAVKQAHLHHNTPFSWAMQISLTFCLIQICMFAFSELPSVPTIHSVYSVVFNFYRICLTRTATGMKPASTASSARIHWWTSLLLQKRNTCFVLIATPMNTLPNVMSARRLSCQVRILTFGAEERSGLISSLISATLVTNIFP